MHLDVRRSAGLRLARFALAGALVAVLIISAMLTQNTGLEQGYAY